MAYKLKMERVIEHIQDKSGVNRSGAIMILVTKYDVSYSSFYRALAGNVTQDRLIRVLDRIVADHPDK